MKKCLTLNKTYLNLKSFYSTPNKILSSKFNLNTSINNTIHNINQNLTLLNPSSTINNNTTTKTDHKQISPYLKRSLTTTKIRLLNIPKMPYLTQSTTSICTKANTTNLSTNRNTESNRSPPPSKISFNYKLKLTKLNNHNTINTSNSTTNISKLSNYKRFLFPLSSSSRTTMKYNNNNTTTINTNRSLTPDTMSTNNNVFISNNTTLSITHSRNYVNHNNNYHQIRHHSPNNNNNNERKCFKHNQMLKTSYSYIANKQREIDKDNQWRKEFYDNIRKKFFNKLLLRKQICERYRYDNIDDNYFQLAMDNDAIEIEHNSNNNSNSNSNSSKHNNNKHKQIIFSCIPSKTNGLLNIVNKANADLLKYSDSFIKLNSSSFNDHYSYILHQYQTYRKNANIKGTTLQCSSSSSRKPKPNLSQLTHIHNKYELIKRDYTKLQHLLQKYISPSPIPQA